MHMVKLEEVVEFAQQGSYVEFTERSETIKRLLQEYGHKISAEQTCLLQRQMADCSRDRQKTLQQFKSRLEGNDVSSKEAAILNWNIDVLQRNNEPWDYFYRMFIEMMTNAINEGTDVTVIKTRLIGLEKQIIQNKVQYLAQRIETDPTALEDFLRIPLETIDWKKEYEQKRCSEVTTCEWIWVIIGAILVTIQGVWLILAICSKSSSY